jgi:putative transcriptional regulator
MIKYKLKELVLKKEREEGRKITLTEVAKAINVSRITLYRMNSQKKNFSTKTEFIDRLCKYFKCTCDDLIILIPDIEPPPDSNP